MTGREILLGGLGWGIGVCSQVFFLIHNPPQKKASAAAGNNKYAPPDQPTTTKPSSPPTYFLIYLNDGKIGLPGGAAVIRFSSFII